MPPPVDLVIDAVTPFSEIVVRFQEQCCPSLKNAGVRGIGLKKGEATAGGKLLGKPCLAGRSCLSSEKENGRSDRIRTCDVLVPNQVLYRAELRSDNGDIIASSPQQARLFRNGAAARAQLGFLPATSWVVGRIQTAIPTVLNTDALPPRAGARRANPGQSRCRVPSGLHPRRARMFQPHPRRRSWGRPAAG